MAGVTKGTLIGLCTAAVGVIYAAGYLYTEPAAQASGTGGSNAIGAPSPRPTSSTNGSRGSSTKSPNDGTHPSTQSKTPKPATNASPYHDGTYSGSGSNSYGTLSVSLTVTHGEITTVRITSYYMHYPQSFIDPQMVNEVLSKQTWRVYIVSGATASSDNFGEAVSQALQKAKA